MYNITQCLKITLKSLLSCVLHESRKANSLMREMILKEEEKKLPDYTMLDVV